MEFNFIVLGKNLRRIGEKKGNWMALKCFIGTGDKDYGEFYLNLNPKTGEGEILKKDGDYAYFLINEFTREIS